MTVDVQRERAYKGNVKRRFFLAAIGLIAALPSKLFSHAARTPAKRYVKISNFDDLKPGMMQDYVDRGKSGTLKLIRPVVHGEEVTNIATGETEVIKDHYCCKWWCTHSHTKVLGEQALCCFDHYPDWPNLKFYTLESRV